MNDDERIAAEKRARRADALYAAAVVCVGSGAALVSIPAGLIVFGAMLGLPVVLFWLRAKG